MSGSAGKSGGKQLGCQGKYYGYGLISKYEMKNKLTVFQFAGNEKEDETVQHLITTLRSDVEYTMEKNLKGLPNALNCGFAIIWFLFIAVKASGPKKFWFPLQ